MQRQTAMGRMAREQVRAQSREGRRGLSIERDPNSETEEERRFRLRKLFAAERRGWQSKMSDLASFLGNDSRVCLARLLLVGSFSFFVV